MEIANSSSQLRITNGMKYFSLVRLSKKKQKASSQSKGPHLDADKCQAEIPGESAGAVQWEFLMERFPGRVEDALHA